MSVYIDTYVYIKYRVFIVQLYAQVNTCVYSMFVRANKKVSEPLQLEWQKQKATTILTTAKKLQNKNNNVAM